MIYARAEPPSVDDIEALLLMQDAQFEKFRQELPSPSVTVNVAQASSLQDSSSSQNFHQNQGGNRGRGNRGRSGGGDRGGLKPTCQLCHKYGHEAFDCWYQFDQAFVQPQRLPGQLDQPSQA